MAFEPLVLASESPRRIGLLQQIGIEFEQIPAKGEEPSAEPKEDSGHYVKRTALWKAKQVCQQRPDHWILAADTIVQIDDQILGKPKNPTQAVTMLSQLQGKEHQVVTGFVLLHTQKDVLHQEVVTTKVFFRNLSSDFIQQYVNTGEPLDKAGAYAIQGKGATFVSSIEGCYFNVVGLPIGHVVSALETSNAGTLI